MTAIVAVNPGALQGFLFELNARLGHLKIRDSYRNSQLDPSSLPGSQALKEVDLYAKEVIGRRMADLSGGLTAIGVLTYWCANHLVDLQGRSAEDIRAAQNKDMPNRNPVRGHDRRFTSDVTPPINVAAFMPIVNTPDGTIFTVPLLDSLTLEQQRNAVQHEWEFNISAIRLAAAYWEDAHQELGFISDWLQDQDGAIRRSLEGAASDAINGLIMNWKDAVKPLVSGIANHSSALRRLVSKIATTQNSLAMTDDLFYGLPRSIIAQTGADALTIGDPMHSIMKGVWGTVAGASGRGAVDDLNDSLAQTAKTIFSSVTAEQSSWWAQAPQADPNTDLRELAHKIENSSQKMISSYHLSFDDPPR